MPVIVPFTSVFLWYANWLWLSSYYEDELVSFNHFVCRRYCLVLCLIEAKSWLAWCCWSWKERKAMGDVCREILAATHKSLPFPWYTNTPWIPGSDWKEQWCEQPLAVIWCCVYFWKSKCWISAESITCLKSMYDCVARTCHYFSGHIVLHLFF